MAGVGTPFAQISRIESSPESGLEAASKKAANAQLSWVGQRAGSALIDDAFDLLPQSPSLENFLNLATNKALGCAGSAGGRMLSMDVCRSMDLADSFDLSWLADGSAPAAPPAAPAAAAAMQRQPSAAECAMGPDQTRSRELPAAPPLELQHRTAPGASNNGSEAHCLRAAAPPAPPAAPFVAGAGGEAAVNAQLAALQQQLALQHAIAAGIYSQSAPLAWTAGTLYSDSCTAPSGSNSAARLQGGCSALGICPPTSPQNTPPGFCPVAAAPLPPPPGSLRRAAPFYSAGAKANADAMTLWAQQNALMQALSSEDVGAALQAVGAGFAGGGARAPGDAKICPFQVQVCTTPALRVAAVSNPIRLSQTPAKQGSDSPCLTPKKDDGRA